MIRTTYREITGDTMFKARKYSAFLTALVVSVGAGVAASPALADENENLKIGVQYTAPLYFGGFDSEIAAKNGHELRVDSRGLQYITSIATPAGDLTGANYLPRPVDVNGEVIGGVPESAKAGTASARGVITGDCGSASIFFESNTQYQTSYTFNKPGGTFDHTWIVRGTSSTSSKDYNLSGLAPYGGAGWISGLKSFSQSGWVDFIKVTTGTAYGVLGYVCYSGNPTASR